MVKSKKERKKELKWFLPTCSRKKESVKFTVLTPAYFKHGIDNSACM
jgi:hypothetical protein